MKYNLYDTGLNTLLCTYIKESFLSFIDLYVHTVFFAKLDFLIIR